MIWVSLTRLRIRSPLFLPGFFWHALRSQQQVKRAEGYLAGSLLPDHDRTFWTMTLWTDRAAMLAYMTSGAHMKAMPTLLRWCDEASVAGWEQETADLPSWEQADSNMRTLGRPSKVYHPSPAQQRSSANALDYRTPRTTRAVTLQKS